MSTTGTLADIASAWPADVRDTCGNVFGNSLRAYNPPIPANAKVLEIGCAEFDALRHATAAWPQMSFTGIDWRRSQPKVDDGAVRIQGDVMRTVFPGSAFDWIFSISAIEHVGLGHYNADPKHPDGDRIAMQQAFRWLKPGGLFYFDVPWNLGEDAYQVVGTSHRVYDDATVKSRLLQGMPWTVVWSGVYGKGGEVVTAPQRLKGGESFYYKAYWLMKG